MKPVLFLDIDGVLNVLPRYSPAKKTWDFDAPSTDWKDLVTFQISDGHQRWPMRFSKEMGMYLRDLVEVVEVRWLTTWGKRANTSIAPILGLPTDSPVAAYPTLSGGGRWKAWAVREFAEDLEPGRPFVWVDDDAIDAWAIEWASTLETPHLLVPTIEYEGITKVGFTLIHSFVENVKKWSEC